MRLCRHLLDFASRSAACHGACLTVLCVGLGGCSDGTPRRYPVQGKVVFPDGTTLTRGTVEFQSLDGNPPLTATGSIQPEGTFELETKGKKDGAVAGRHRVIVVGDDEVGTSEERPWKLSRSLVHPRYASFRTSGLEVIVEPKRNSITIDVEYAAEK